MSKHKKYQQLYDRLLDEVKALHERIKVGIRQGLKMLIIVPLVFMLVMFLTQGSKGIFLVLWIVSTFVIAAFLIALEYVDHGIQKRLEEITGMENELPDDSLMPEIELPEIDLEELRIAAQEHHNQLSLHKLKEKWENDKASDDTGEASEDAVEAEAAAEEAEPIVEAPFIFEELPEEAAAEEKALEAEVAAEEAAEAAESAEPMAEAVADEPAEAAASETEDTEDVVKV
jgi:hypothetical protein